MSDTSFSKKLWSRQVPQLLGTYLAVGFGVLQFVEFMTSRYDFSGAWVDRYLLLWLGLIPAVALLIYYRGLPPAGKGRGWKRSFLGLNFLLVGLLAFFLPGSAHEAETEVVAVVDESGETKQRVIPTSSSVQRIAVFDFIDPEDKADNEWWGTAYALLLNDHLRQRPEVLTTSTNALNSYYDRFGVKQFEPINLATQRRIAERARTDFFVRLEYEVTPDGHAVNGELYRTRDGKAVQTIQGADESIYGVVDQVKAQILDYLPTLDELNSISTELPAAALITDKVAALEAYIKGVKAFALNAGDLDTPSAYFRESIRIDPNCAPCAYGLGDKLYGQGKKDSSLLLLRKATRLADVLPEREQYGYKSTLLSVEGEYESLAKLMELFRRVYPYEYYPYASLSSYYELNYGLDSTIHLMEVAAQLSDREKALKKLFRLQLKGEKFEAAENIIKDLEQEFPDEEKTSQRYAELYRSSGQIDKARELIADRMATDPLNTDLPNQLLQIEQDAGNYAAVEKLARKVLKRASTRTDSTTAWNFLIQSLAGSGRVRESLEELEEYEASLSAVVPKNILVMRNYPTRSNYLLHTGEYDRIESYLLELGTYDPGRSAIYRCYLPMQIVGMGFREDADLEVMEGCTEEMAKMGPAVGQLFEVFSAALRGEADKGADIIDELLANKQDPAEAVVYARVNRWAGRYDRAIELLENELKIRQQQPELLLEYALIKQLQGDEKAAMEALEGPLKAWRKADSNFRSHRIALELADQLGMKVQ